MKIVNCTPHTLTFVGNDGAIIREIPASGILPRVASSINPVGDIDGIPDEATVYGEVQGMPEPEEGTIYVVSTMVASRLPTRSDIRVPGRQVRDAAGRVIGCQSLSNPNAGLFERIEKYAQGTNIFLDPIPGSNRDGQWMDAESYNWYVEGIWRGARLALGLKIDA